MAKVKVTIDPKFSASVAKDKQAIQKAAKVQPRKEFDGPDGRYIGKLSGISAKPDKNGKLGVNLSFTLTKHNEDYVGSPLGIYFGLSEAKNKKGEVWKTKEEAYANLFGALKHCGVPEKLLTETTLTKALNKLAEIDPTCKLSVKTNGQYKNIFINGLFEDAGVDEDETATDDDEGGSDDSGDDASDDSDDSGDDASSDDDSSDDDSSDDAGDDDSGDDEASDDDSSDDEGEDAADDEPVIPTKGDKYMFIVKGKNKGKPSVHVVEAVNRAKSLCTLKGAYGVHKNVPFDSLGDLVADDDE